MLRKYLILTGIFLLASLSAAYLEEYYRQMVRYFFETLTSSGFRFHGKNFHFTSIGFVFTFGLFCALSGLSYWQQSKAQLILKVVLSFILFIITTLIFSYFDATAKLMACTACDEGIRDLSYNEINYDLFFIASLIAASIPALRAGLQREQKKTDDHISIVAKLEEGKESALYKMLWQPKKGSVNYLPATIAMIRRLKKTERSNSGISIYKKFSKGNFELVVLHVPWLEDTYCPLIINKFSKKIMGIKLPFPELQRHISIEEIKMIEKLGAVWLHFITGQGAEKEI